MTDLREAWYVGAALVALGRQAPEKRAASFRRIDLEQLCTQFKGKRTTTTRAIEHLGVLGFLRRSSAHQRPGQPAYVLTQEGVQAALAAVEAFDRNAQAAEDPFARRLWALLRARGQLTPPQAADVLSDAGEGDAERFRDRASRYLSAWARVHPKAVQLSAKRVEGAKRYVLLQDLGPQVPTVCHPGSART